MTQEQPPIRIDEPEWDRSLWRMVAASGVLHVIAIALLIVVPYRFLHRPPALKSYTVDLIAPDHVGGTNMIAGGKGRIEGPPMAAASKVEEPKPPPPPKAEQPKPPEPKPEPPKPEPPKPEPQKVEPPKPEPPKEIAKPEPKPQPAKPEPQPKENEAVLAEKVKPEPPPVPKPAPQTKPVEPPKAIAKAEPPKPQPKAESKAAAEAAEKAAKEAAVAHARDEQIEVAVKRMQQQMGKRGAGSGSKPGEQPGAPISVGPGEGAGGTVRGVDYLLYYNQMINRIKQAWAWAGANQTLEATVGFSITETGDVVNVRIKQPSGDPSYDASVERAVRAVNPLTPPPEAYRKEFNDVEITFSPKDLAG
jgi:colicin import membrane protein